MSRFHFYQLDLEAIDFCGYVIRPHSIRSNDVSTEVDPVASESCQLEIETTYSCSDQQRIGSHQRNRTAFLKQ